jgi:hypothetical protein
VKINVHFLNGSNYWRNKVLTNAAIASKILSDIDFLAIIASQPKYDFTADTSDQVAAKIADTYQLTISVSFLWRPWPSKMIADEAPGLIRFNTAKERYGAGSVENIVHETMHALNYSHDGNSPQGQGNTVPWRVAALARAYLSRVSL